MSIYDPKKNYLRKAKIFDDLIIEFCSSHLSNIQIVYFREYLGRQLEKDVGGDAKLPIKAS